MGDGGYIEDCCGVRTELMNRQLRNRSFSWSRSGVENERVKRRDHYTENDKNHREECLLEEHSEGPDAARNNDLADGPSGYSPMATTEWTLSLVYWELEGVSERLGQGTIWGKPSQGLLPWNC